MALRFAFAALAVGAVGVTAQTTDDLNFYSLTDDYFATRTSSTKTSMFWTVTQRYMDYVSLRPYTYVDETTTYEYTSTRTIKASVTPTVTATYSTSYKSAYIDVEIHEEYYPTGAVAESDLVSKSYYDYYSTSTPTATTKSTYSTTEYYMPVTMTAPASCPTVFTVATQAEISYIPYIVTDQLQPSSTEVSTSEDRSYVYEYATWYLTAGAAPFTSSLESNYYYYIASCTAPPAAYTTSSRTSGGSGSGGGSTSRSGSDDDIDSWMDYRTCYFGGCTSVKTWIIIIATVLPGIFLLGFLESWFWYTRLMKGKSAMRGGTICWILLSLWVMCFTRMQDARSKEDQALLRQKWAEMPFGKKFRNWSWGFKRRYPVPLLGQFSKQTVGIVPEGQPLHPAMAQAPGQVFYYGPPPPGTPGFQPGAQGYGMPPQGYPPQGHPQGEYYARNVPKEGVVVGSAPVAWTVTPPQPVHQAPRSPPPQAQLPPPPQQKAPVLPPLPNMNEAPTEQAREVSNAQAPSVPAAGAPPAPAAETSHAPAMTQPQPTPPAPAPAKNDNEDLYK